MSLFTVKIPPGMNRGETEAKSAGAWYSGSFCRNSPGGDAVPEKGWASRSASAVTGIPRAMLVWKDNADTSRIGAGTEQGLFTYSLDGVLTNITPVGFSAGYADTTVNTGYSGGTYGTGYYGISRPLTGIPVDASMWSLAVWDEYLIGCCSTDGHLYQYNNDGNPATVITNAPILNRATFVAEIIVLALGADGNPRKVAWSDKGNNTVWTPSDTNQAGDYSFPTSGRLMCGAAVAGQALVLSDVDAWIGAYGEPAIWDFRKLGDGIGAISQGALVSASTQAYWWSLGGFKVLEGGFMSPLTCKVWDAITADINLAQRAKIVGWLNSIENEVVWAYPSASSIECDRKVTVNTSSGAWWISPYSRTCGCDRIENGNPLAMSPGGALFDHETGFNFDGASPRMRTGPIRIAEGDSVMKVQGYIPDQRTLGEATLTVYGKNRPTDDYTVFGPFNAAAKVDFRATARIVELEYIFTGPGAVGEPQLEVLQGPKR